MKTIAKNGSLFSGLLAWTEVCCRVPVTLGAGVACVLTLNTDRVCSLSRQCVFSRSDAGGELVQRSLWIAERIFGQLNEEFCVATDFNAG